jgi:ABC-type transport system involved in multi-copper enzyme maturation permease subunit
MSDASVALERAPLPKPGWVGPLAGFDLVRLARQRRSFIIRFLYAGFLLAIAALYFARIATLIDVTNQQGGLMARLAEGFVVQFFIWQGLALFVFVPAYLGGAVSEEREKGTLDLLFTTHLTTWEFVAGKLLSRLVHLFGLLLVGVPVLALAQLLGGVNPAMLVAQTLVTAAGLWSFGCYCLMKSAQSRSVTQGVIRSYGGLLGFQVGAIIVAVVCSCGLLTPLAALSSPLVFTLLGTQIASSGLLIAAAAMFTLCHVAAGSVFLNKTLCNLRRWQYPEGPRGMLLKRSRRAQIIAQSEAEDATGGKAATALNGDPAAAPPAAVPPAPASPENQAAPPSADGDYVMVVRNLGDEDRSAPRSVDEQVFFPRPPIGARPLLWKEVHTGRRFTFLSVLAAFLTILLATFCCIVVIFVLPWFVITVLSGDSSATDLTALRGCLTAAFYFLYVLIACAAASRAAASIARERTQRTWESLLALPCAREEILLAKAAGSLLIHKPWLLALGALVALMLLTGAVHPLSALFQFFMLPAQVAALLAFCLWLSGNVQERLVAQVAVVGLLFIVALADYAALTYSTLAGGLDRWAAACQVVLPLSAIRAVFFSWSSGFGIDLMARFTTAVVHFIWMALLAVLFFWLALRPYLPARPRHKPSLQTAVSTGTAAPHRRE